MLNWLHLTAQQKLLGTLGIVFCLCFIFLLFSSTVPGRTPPIGMPLMAIGWLLHPGAFAKGNRTVAWRGAPLLVKVVWAAGIAAAGVSVASGLARMFA